MSRKILLIMILTSKCILCEENFTFNSYDCPSYNLTYSSNVIEFLSPLLTESMIENITELANSL